MKSSLAIAAAIRDSIARGEYEAGHPLPPEKALTELFRCSKPVVREALRILETEGLVTVKVGVGGGARVRHPSIGEAAGPMGVYLQLADAPVIDIWETRDALVAGAIERLARSETALDPLADQISRLEAAVGDFPAFNREMVRTSEVAVELSGGVTSYVIVVALRHIVSGDLEAASRGAPVYVGIAAEQSVVQAWQRVLRHLRGRRPAAARRTFDEHAEGLRRGIALAPRAKRQPMP